MSRCFPFPPPGYIRNGEHNEALIESIKLQRDLEKAKQDKKKEKREKKRKKERKKENKERKLKKGATSHGSDGKKLKHIDDLKDTKADGNLQKGKGEDLETEQLERSGITDEHEQPVSSQEPCCLSDSTQSSKRKRSASPSGLDHGIAIKIRLPLRKHKEPEQPKLDQVGTSNPLAQGTSTSGHQMLVTNAEANQSLGNSDSRHCKNLVHSDTVMNNRPHDERKRMEDLYKSLLQNPLMVELLELDSEDEDWLFRSDLLEANAVSRKAKSVSNAVQCSTPSLWPHAQYLPEVEIYALPYTVQY